MHTCQTKFPISRQNTRHPKLPTVFRWLPACCACSVQRVRLREHALRVRNFRASCCRRRAVWRAFVSESPGGPRALC